MATLRVLSVRLRTRTVPLPVSGADDLDVTFEFLWDVDDSPSPGPFSEPQTVTVQASTTFAQAYVAAKSAMDAYLSGLEGGPHTIEEGPA